MDKPNTPLLRLLQLSSAALPVGAYAFSQGLEYGVETGWLSDADKTHDWLLLQMQESLAKTDIPILLRQFEAISNADTQQFDYWNSTVLACRETEELRLSDTAPGEALAKLLRELDVPLNMLDDISNAKNISFVSMFAIAIHHWRIHQQDGCYGFIWSWLENQVAAATKLVPLGQVAAQQLLGRLLEAVPSVIETGKAISDEQIGTSLPALAMASSWHETQYSRLFRS